MVGALVVSTFVVAPAGPASAALTLVVRDTGDAPDASPGNGLCGTAGGTCTLRAAIQEANATPGADTITFDLPVTSGADPTITVDSFESPQSAGPEGSSTLPRVTDTVTIDGTTQPGFRFNGDVEFDSAVGRPRIVPGTAIRNETRTPVGLWIEASAVGSVVRGLALEGWGALTADFSNTAGTALVSAAPDVVVESSFLSGATAAVVSGARTRVGGPTFEARNSIGIGLATLPEPVALDVRAADAVVTGNIFGGARVSDTGTVPTPSGPVTIDPVRGTPIAVHADGVVVAQNQFVRTGVPPATVGAVDVANGARRVRVENNVFADAAEPFVRLQGSANDGLAAPIITSVASVGPDLVLTYSVVGAPVAPARLEVYREVATGLVATGDVQMALSLGSFAIDGSGVATIAGAGSIVNVSVTATIIDGNGNTSPFARWNWSGPDTGGVSLTFNGDQGDPMFVSGPFKRGDLAAATRTARPAVSLAAAPVGASAAQGTALVDAKVGETPLSAIVIGSAPLSAIPLSAIGVPGGWEAILAGSVLAGQPPSALTFGQALSTGSPSQPGTPAARIAALPLSAIDLRGTPLSAIPLSAIALGSTPLSAIQLPPPFDWCEIVRSVLPTCGPTDLGRLTVMELSLRGAPLSAIPLSAIPLSAIGPAEAPLSAIPLSAIPLSAISLGASKLGTIPLSAIPLSAIGVQGTPLSAIPLSAIPLSAIPLSAIGPTGTPLSAIPLSAIPLSAIDVAGTPLSAIPLSAILLADTPLSAIPLSAIGTTDWCAVLAETGSGVDCRAGVDPATTTLRELAVRGAPLSAIPLSAIPLSAIPLSAISPDAAPLSAIPLSAIPLSAIPLSAIPLSAISLGSTPLSAIPLSAIDVNGSPLSAIPLSAIPLSAIPLSAIPLSAIPLSAIPLSAIPLSAIQLAGSPLSAIPLSAIDVANSPLSAIPLSAIPLSAIDVDCGRVACAIATVGEAFTAGALPPTATLGQLQPGAGTIRLDELAPFLPGGTAALTAAVGASSGTVDLTHSDLTLGELPPTVYGNVALGLLGDGLNTVTFADLVGRLVDPGTGQPLAGARLRSLVDATPGRTLGTLPRLGDVTLGDLLAQGGPALTLADVRPILGLVTIDALWKALGGTPPTPQGTLGDLQPDQLGRLTLADLAVFAPDLSFGTLINALVVAEALSGFTLEDLLNALLSPSTAGTRGGIDFASIDPHAFTEATQSAPMFHPYSATVANVAPHAAVEVTVDLPPRWGYHLGSATPVAPTVDGQTLTFLLDANGAGVAALRFEVTSDLTTGSLFGELRASVRVRSTGVRATATATNFDGIVEDVIGPFRTAQSGDIYAESMPLDNGFTPDNWHSYRIEIAEGDRLDVLLAKQTIDLDMALWRRPSPGQATSPTTALSPRGNRAPLTPLTDPDGASGVTELQADAPRLDAFDPTVQLVAVSNNPGLADEEITAERLPAGTYFLQTWATNQPDSAQPASLSFDITPAEQPPACRATAPLLGAAPTAFPSVPTIPGGANTLLLVNPTRLQRLYGGTAQADVTAALARLTAYLAAHPELGVVPAVVPVDAYPAVRAAYDAWDAAPGSCDPEAANAIVKAINTAVVDPIRGQLKHLVVLGDDLAIPMARLHDGTTTANEYEFRHQFDGQLAGGPGADQNAATAGFWKSVILSDEPYGDTDAQAFGDRYLYTTDIALGRVVETPAEIVAALDAFVTDQGTLAVDNATVLGYDFLADGSAAVADTLSAAGLPVDRRYALGTDANGQPWTRAQAQDALSTTGTNALVSLNAHFDNYRALPAAGDKVNGFTDYLVAEQTSIALAQSALLQSLAFSMGCHSGYAVPDTLVSATTTATDWAQTLSRRHALFVGNTGYGYGDTTAVAYSEDLMRHFASRVVAPLALPNGPSTASSTVGQALAWAKNDFLASLHTVSVYDEKALQESTFYGLPFYRIGLPPTTPAAPPTVTPVPDATGTPAIDITTSVTNTPAATPLGTYYYTGPASDQQTIVAAGRPIEPKTTRDVSAVSSSDPTRLAAVARGAIVVGMTSTYVPLADPVIGTTVFDTAGRPEQSADDVAFPARTADIRTTTEATGRRQRLVLATGQYRSDTSLQRLDTDIETTVYYAAPDQADVTAPTVTDVDGTFTSGTLTVAATVPDEAGGTGTDRVYVLAVEDPGTGAARTWKGFDLVRDGTTDRWSGSLALAPGTTNVEFVLQAKDDAGNVGVATNKARSYAGTPALVLRPAPPDVVSATAVGPRTAGGSYTGPVTVNVTASEPVVYTVDGDDRGVLATPGSFTITTDGAHTWSVRTGRGYGVDGVVVIDRGTLSVVGTASPAPNAAGWNQTPVTVRWTTDDPSVAPPPDTVVTQEGAAVPVTSAPVCNAAGTCATGSLTLKIDLTGPSVTLVSPANGAVVPQASYVRPTCSATDALSGLDGTCSVTIGDPVTVVGGYTETVTATASDRAGNTTTTAPITYTVRTDASGPVIDPTPTPLPNAAGWWKTPVTFTFVCTDSSGVTTCPTSRTVSTEGANQSFAVSAVDALGNASSLTVSAVNIDLTAPVVTVTAPATVGPLDTVTITCTASDTLSGVASATCVDRTFAASTLTPGANTFTFTATDVAGNTTTVTRTIALVVPANNAPTVRADMGVPGLEEIGFQTTAVAITGTFADPSGPAPYTAAVRWTAGGAFTPLILTAAGQFVAANVYATPGTRTVTVRICDAGGACGTDDVIVRSGVTQRVTPVRQCVVNRGAAVTPRYLARWGYDNPATFAIAIPSVPLLENTFTAQPFLRGQPQVFLPGRKRDVFTTGFSSGSQSWRLNGVTATATTTSPGC